MVGECIDCGIETRGRKKLCPDCRRYRKEELGQRFRKNKRKGKAEEIQGIGVDFLFNGWESERTGRGSDYKQTRRDSLTGKREERLVEYKTGNSKLSRLQKETKKKTKRYKIRRFNLFLPY